jgi:hypothetical protein
MKASQLRPGNVYLRKGHSLRASPTAYLLVSTRRWKLTREIGDRMVRPVLTVPDSTDRLSRSRYMNRSETTIGFLAVTLPDAMVEQLTQHVADPAFDVSQFPPIKQLHRRALDDLDEAPDVEHITDRLIEGDRFHAEPLADPLDGTVLVIPADLDGELALMARARDHYRRQRLAAQQGQSARAERRERLSRLHDRIAAFLSAGTTVGLRDTGDFNTEVAIRIEALEMLLSAAEKERDRG